ncbi:MAG: succinate dehydrogenase assembly factor 2 [Inhella sp.]|jgi:antitoxin CptB|uniref:FAD assembly factor SdhE n=1 Tax=Inhella sp. TaxID=1921806 RepID=UPI0022C4E569|nr:succinate dehydrogenase assembly factor 2 [Inhella sp.]MCZ8235886.1 succinate dehydrogenase assembly factor 2 [Inhella sp.]
MTACLNERELSKLHWRCRRGLLENDLFIERFFRRQAEQITVEQGEALTRLMELSDNDLLDLLLARTEPEGDLDHPDIHALLSLMRQPRPHSSQTQGAPR